MNERRIQEADDRRAGRDRREDFSVRAQVQVLLELIRDFYTTCHMVAVGQLEPAKAKVKAQEVEQRLNEMMARMLDIAESAQEGDENGS